jgi:hypothetical protein
MESISNFEGVFHKIDQDDTRGQVMEDDLTKLQAQVLPATGEVRCALLTGTGKKGNRVPHD